MAVGNRARKRASGRRLPPRAPFAARRDAPDGGRPARAPPRHTLVFPTQTRPAAVLPVAATPVPPPVAAPVTSAVAISRTVAASAASRAVAPPVVAAPVPAAVVVAPADAAVAVAARPAWAEVVPAPVAVPERAPAVRGRAKAPAEAFEAAPAAASAGKVGSGAARAEMQRSMLGKAPATVTPDDGAARGGRAKG